MNARLLALVGALLMSASPLLKAHHSFAAEYDSNKPVKVTGVVTKVEWTNPHIWFYVDVKDEQGKVTQLGLLGRTSGRAPAPGYQPRRDEERRRDRRRRLPRTRRIEQCVGRPRDLC